MKQLYIADIQKTIRRAEQKRARSVAVPEPRIPVAVVKAAVTREWRTSREIARALFVVPTEAQWWRVTEHLERMAELMRIDQRRVVTDDTNFEYRRIA